VPATPKGEIASYCWVSEREVLLWRVDANDAAFPVPSTSKPSTSSGAYRWFNRATGQESIVAPLEKRFGIPFLMDARFSPDRAWLLWWDGFKKRGFCASVTSVTGNSVASWPQEEPARLQWFPDNRHFLVVSDTPRLPGRSRDAAQKGADALACVYGTDGKMRARTRLRSVPVGPQYSAPQAVSHQIAAVYDFNPRWEMEPRERRAGRLNLWQWRVRPGNVFPVRRTLRFPKGATLNGVLLSPWGGRIACWFQFARGTAAAQGTATAGDSLWTISLQDGMFRTVTSLDEVYAAHPCSGSLPETIHSLQWLPDGKHLSFLYCGSLYTVSAG